MDEMFDQLETLTKDLVNNIYQVDYLYLSEFVDIREQYMNDCKELIEASVVEQKHLDQIQRILSYDKVIFERLSFLKEEALQGIQKTKLAKQQQSMYETNAYGQESSYFFDKKK